MFIVCDEGDLTHPSQLVLVDPATGDNSVLLNNFLGRNFSSINDIEQHPYTGDLWVSLKLILANFGNVADLLCIDGLPMQDTAIGSKYSRNSRSEFAIT